MKRNDLTWRDVERLEGLINELESQMNTLGCPLWLLTPEGFYTEVLRRFEREGADS